MPRVGEWVEVAKLEELQPGSKKRIIVEMPLHGSQLDIRDGSIVRKQKDEIDQWFEKKGFPVIQSKPLRTYEVVLEGGSIKLRL